MEIDVICLTKTSNRDLWVITDTAIHTLHDSEKTHQFKVHLVESDTSPYSEYTGVANYIKPNEQFNYNRFINLCQPYIKSDWVIIMNNDVRFERGWFSEVLEVYNKRPDIESFSPKCPILYAEYYRGHFVGNDEDYHESYKVTEFLTGWCYIMKKRVFDAVYPWDEQFDLYYQDNDYARKIEALGIRHALVRDSVVSHLGSQTIDRETNTQKLRADKIKFHKKWD